MDLENKVLNAISKLIYCDKHSHGDIIGFMLIEGQDEDYQLIKDYFHLTPQKPFEYKLEDNKNQTTTEQNNEEDDFEKRFSL